MMKNFNMYVGITDYGALAYHLFRMIWNAKNWNHMIANCLDRPFVYYSRKKIQDDTPFIHCSNFLMYSLLL